MIGATYAEKLPRDVLQGMGKVTESDCYFINRRINSVTGGGAMVINLHAKYAFIKYKSLKNNR